MEKDDKQPEQLTEATVPEYQKHAKTIVTRHETGVGSKTWKTIGVILLCFVASFLGSWLLLTSGLVKPDASQTLTENREKLVLQEGEVVADVAKKVTPSVVSIVTQSQVQSGFRTLQQEGAGTGVIISSDGYVITNKHVIPDNASSVSVVRADGTIYDNVTVVGRDPLNDVAFLKIRDVKDLPAVKIGDSSKIAIGQKVIAIGNALGEFPNTVTSGIISGIGRPITAGEGSSTEQLENLFQTDAAINPGNSGGPLLNLSGEMIGMNTAIAQEAQGIGFAIPIDTAKGVIKTVLHDGQVKRAYLGVRYVTLDAAIAKEFNLSVKQGAYVHSDDQSAVVKDSPASKAGIKENDIITKVNGNSLDRLTLSGVIAQYVPGDAVTLTVLRDGKPQDIRVVLDELR